MFQSDGIVCKIPGVFPLNIKREMEDEAVRKLHGIHVESVTFIDSCIVTLLDYASHRNTINNNTNI